MEKRFWKEQSWKAFWLAFTLTLLVMTPGVAAVWAASYWQKTPAADRQEGIPICQPNENHQLTVLAVVAGDDPAFVLVRLDAMNQTFALGGIPAESVVRVGNGSQTLRQCYEAAGPARVARLLTETLEVPINRYLSATPETWQKLVEDLGPVQVLLHGALTEEQRRAAGLSETAESWTAAGAHRFLQHLETMDKLTMPPQSTALTRAVLWQGWARQKLDQLPRVLPQTMKQYSGRLLTDFTATELFPLAETLEFLANGHVQPQVGVLPGKWNGETGRYEFSDETVGWLQAFFSSEASASACETSSVLYPSTTVCAGQRPGWV